MVIQGSARRFKSEDFDEIRRAYLLRHAVPQGDLATIVERALDLLLEQTMKRRFGATTRPQRKTPGPAGAVALEQSRPDGQPCPKPDAAGATHGHASTAVPSSPSEGDMETPAATELALEPMHMRSPAHTRYIPIAIRRAVLARDGARCTWHGLDGVRCESRAWLELDHVTPVGQGGGHSTSNTRLFCRPHNRLAAEQAYGRATITRILARRRAVGERPARPVTGTTARALMHDRKTAGGSGRLNVDTHTRVRERHRQR